MNTEDDIERVKRQEQELVLSNFDEAVAYEIGSSIRARAKLS